MLQADTSLLTYVTNVTSCKQSVSSLFRLLILLIYDTDCLQVVTTVTKGKEMLEKLKEAEEFVKKFNSLPEEQRYYYDKGVGEVMIIKLIDSIRLEHNEATYYCLKGHVADNEHRWWSRFFYDTDSLVTEEEAMKQAKEDTRRLEKRIEKIKSQREALEYELEALEEELKNMKGHNKC